MSKKTLTQEEINCVKELHAMCKLIKNKGISTFVTMFVIAAISTFVAGVVVMFNHLLGKYNG